MNQPITHPLTVDCCQFYSHNESIL